MAGKPIERLTDSKTAAGLRSNMEKLIAAGIEPNVSDLIYIRLAEYEEMELEKENAKLKAAIALIKELWKRLQKDMAIVTGKTEELIGEDEQEV